MSEISRLLENQKELKLWSSIQSVLFWDQLTVMPKLASQYRGEQNALLAKTAHQLATSAEYEDQVLKAYEEAQSLEADHPHRVQVARIKEKFQRSKKLSQDLVSRLAKASVAGSSAWEQAKAEGNPKGFVQELENLVSLAHEKAEAYGFDDTPYDALLEDFEPEMSCNDFDKLYSPLAGELAQLVREAKDDAGFAQYHGPSSQASQEALSQKLMTELGFSFDDGNIMTSSHPFSITMGQKDFRITTRYHEDEPFSAFYSTAHEVGHSLYERGLKKEYFGTPLGSAATSGVHESQSLFWENRVCRSPEFLDNWHLSMTQLDSLKGWSPDELKRTVNRVQPSFIRVEADETTYCLHIIIRFEIEKRLFSGQLKPSEVEDAWNELYEKYLGVIVETPKLGFLQDVHWSEGLFGYFPSYALGHILSAQFSATMDKDLGGLSKRIAQRDYASLRQWLGEKIHHKGEQYYAKDLIKDISGEELSYQPFIDYLKAKRKKIQA